MTPAERAELRAILDQLGPGRLTVLARKAVDAAADLLAVEEKLALSQAALIASGDELSAAVRRAEVAEKALAEERREKLASREELERVRLALAASPTESTVRAAQTARARPQSVEEWRALEAERDALRAQLATVSAERDGARALADQLGARCAELAAKLAEAEKVIAHRGAVWRTEADARVEAEEALRLTTKQHRRAEDLLAEAEKRLADQEYDRSNAVAELTACKERLAASEAKLAEAEKARDEAEENLGAAQTDFLGARGKMKRDLAAAEAQVAATREALEKYGHHALPGCHYAIPQTCHCGLTAALSTPAPAVVVLGVEEVATVREGIHHTAACLTAGSTPCECGCAAARALLDKAGAR